MLSLMRHRRSESIANSATSRKMEMLMKMEKERKRERVWQQLRAFWKRSRERRANNNRKRRSLNVMVGATRYPLRRR